MDAATQATPDSESDPKTVVVRQYGLLAPLDWGEDCSDELRKQTAFWNALVDIEQEHRSDYHEVTSSDARVRRLQEDFERLDQELEDCVRRRKKMRSDTRKQSPTDLDDTISRLKADRQAIAAGLKNARTEARVAIRPLLHRLEESRKAAVKAARQNSDLYWGNYNAVWSSYERARRAALARAGQGGKLGTLRFQRFDGSGRITNQIQGGITVHQLFEGTHSLVQVLARPEHPGHAKHLLRATVYRHGRGEKSVHRTVVWPMIMHRPIPDDVMIKQVTVHRRRLGAKWRWTATFSCTTGPDCPEPAGNRIVAINLGWRLVQDRLRVATVMADGEPPYFVELTPEIIEGLTRPDRIRERRDRNLADWRQWLSEIPWHQAPPELQAIAAKVKCASRISASRLASLAIAWRQHQTWRPTEFSVIEQWRKRDKRLWQYEANCRDQAVRRRLDLCRNLACRVTADAAAIIFNRFDIAKAARITEDNQLHSSARHQRMLAAAGVLRECIKERASRLGIQIIEHKGISTWRCSNCDMPIAPSEPAALYQTCQHCRTIWDQDQNACQTMLKQHRLAYPSVQPIAERSFA
jgi:hypothetical protein